MTKCPFCNATDSFKNRLFLNPEYSYEICRVCGGGFLDPQPTTQKLEKIYGSKNYFEGLSSKVENSIAQWILTRRVYDIPSEWINRKFKTGRVLDIGCGNGEFLGELKKKGWDVYGTDISSIAIRNTVRRIGKGKVRQDDFLKIKFRGKFDLISFWHVLEHIPNPLDYIKKSKKLLEEEGKLVGEVPNFDSFWVKLFKSSYVWIIVPEHRIYFSRRSLYKLLKRAGFKSITIYTPTRGLLNFSISLNRYLSCTGLPAAINKLIFAFLFPVSIVLGLVASFLRRGEVLRFIAKK